MESGTCNDILLFLSLLISDQDKKRVIFEQTIGLTTKIKYSTGQLLQKPLIDLINMTNSGRLKYYLEEIKVDSNQ